LSCMRYIFPTGRHPVEMTGQEVPATDRNPLLAPPTRFW